MYYEPTINWHLIIYINANLCIYNTFQVVLIKLHQLIKMNLDYKCCNILYSHYN